MTVKKKRAGSGRRTTGLKPEDEVKVLRAITRTISHGLDLEQVLKHIIETVVQFTGGDACLLYLFDDKKEQLVLRASKNPHPGMLGKIKLKAGEGITGWVAKERKPVAITRNASDDPRFKVFHSLPEDKYQAFLSAPVISKGEVIGVINVQHRRARRHSPREMALLTSIAQQTGGAIENAKLMEEVLTARKSLEARKVIDRAKGILMKETGMSEDGVYKMIHRKSMNTRRSMKEIAEAIVLSAEITGG